jgi:hypothetical protein
MQALAMIDAFTGVGARGFDITILDINGDEVPGQQRPRCDLAETRRIIGKALHQAEENQQSVIIRPRSTDTKLIQLDDLDAAKAARLAAHAFIEIETSPGNFQSWVAVSDIPKNPEEAKDFARRLKQGTGADRSATAAVRIAGSRNFKKKYAPHFPVVRITRATAGRLTTVAQLEQAGLVAPREEPAPMPPASVPQIFSAGTTADRKWPDYQRALQGAPPKSDGSGPDRSLADFMFAKWSIQRGWSIEETAAKLIELSETAQQQARRNDEGYARVTAFNAARAVQRDQGRSRPRSGSPRRSEI